MTGYARRRLFDRDHVGVYHCWSRCVRGAFLCGQNKETGQDYSHRRDWILTREEQLARLFAIEVDFHAEMANHLHLMLRTRPDVARRWGRLEVARRWLTITRLAKCMDDSVPIPDEKRVVELAKNKKVIAKLRRRLSNISWFVGILCENIARRANREDDCKGRFWESRFRCRECADESAILLCGIYVDMNPIRAGEAKSPQTARYTSVFQRIQAQHQRKNARNRADGWLGELTFVEGTIRDERVVLSSQNGRRASDLGLLPISLDDYLKLLTWTGRLIRAGRRDTIPADLEAILDRLSIRGEAWLDGVDGYEDLFSHVVGSPQRMAATAERMGVRCVKGAPTAAQIFS